MVKGFVAEISFAVKHLHDRGIIHRDIKLDNILVTSRGHAKVMDFGVSSYVPRKMIPEKKERSSSQGKTRIQYYVT